MGAAKHEDSHMASTRLGLSCAISTPFTREARVDTARLADHANWCLREGCDSVTLFGTTGDGAAVGVSDRQASIKALLAAGIAPAQLLSGVTACSIDDAVAQARVAMDAGLHGLLLTPPWYFRDATDDGLFAWFSAFFTAMSGKARNVFLYHIPSMTGVPLSVDLVGRLKKAFPGVVVGVKDSSGSWENTDKLLTAHGDLQILVGDERQLARAVKQGGAGTICGLANVMPSVVRKAAHDGVDDPRIAQAVTTILQFSFMPAVKVQIAHQRNDAAWRTMAPPLTALTDAQAQKLIADYGKLSSAKAA